MVDSIHFNNKTKNYHGKKGKWKMLLFYLWLYGVGHMVKYHLDSERKPAAATLSALSD